MTRPPTWYSNRPLVFAVAAFVVVVGIAIVVSWRYSVALDERGQPATAEVISAWESRHGSATAKVRFTTADGRTITTTTRPDELVNPPPAVGSTIPIVYNPDNPQAPVRDPRAPRDNPVPPLLAAGAGAVLLGVFVVTIVRRRTRL